jgi:Fe-S-cluster containining protein
MTAPGDLTRIAEYLGVGLHIALTSFRASPGALVAKYRPGSHMTTFRIPTIVPAADDTGRCVFLSNKGKCSIHPVAPFGCSHFSMCSTTKTEGDRRSAACLHSIMADAEYSAHWQTLTARGLTTTAPEQKRQAMKEKQ